LELSFIPETEPLVQEADASPVSPSKKKGKIKDKILVLNNKWNLAPELPPKLVYWVRCETRV
jgi:hypothetical protein